MRRYFLPVFAIIILAATSCQQNIEKEKEAILAVLQEESDAVVANDKERVFAVHVRDSLESRWELGIYGYNMYKGWNEVQTLLSDFMGDGMGNTDPVNVKENMTLKVAGKSAWLTCDNIWKWTVDGHPGGYNNIQITFLEKIKGEWKISFSAYYTKPVPIEDLQEPVN